MYEDTTTTLSLDLAIPLKEFVVGQHDLSIINIRVLSGFWDGKEVQCLLFNHKRKFYFLVKNGAQVC